MTLSAYFGTDFPCRTRWRAHGRRKHCVPPPVEPAGFAARGL